MPGYFVLDITSQLTNKTKPPNKTLLYCYNQQFHLVEQIKCLSMFYGDRLGQDKIPHIQIGPSDIPLLVRFSYEFITYVYVCVPV